MTERKKWLLSRRGMIGGCVAAISLCLPKSSHGQRQKTPSSLGWLSSTPGIDPLLDNKRPYLTVGFFLFRAVFYFALLSLIALTLRKRSIAQDSDGRVNDLG